MRQHAPVGAGDRANSVARDGNHQHPQREEDRDDRVPDVETDHRLVVGMGRD
jgi:hypothetical protein